MSKTKAIFFDSDGTLLNSFELCLAAYFHVAETHDLPIPDAAAVKDKMARSLPLHQIFSEVFPGQDTEQLIQTNGEYVSTNAMKIEGFEGMHEVLNSLVEEGYKLAIVTGGDERVVDIYKHHGIDHLFSSIVHVGRTKKHKPDPEGVRLAAHECGVLPEEAIMVGDSRNDILAGKNAGCKATIALTHGNDTKENLEIAGADYIVDSLLALPDLIGSIE